MSRSSFYKKYWVPRLILRVAVVVSEVTLNFNVIGGYFLLLDFESRGEPRFTFDFPVSDL